MNFIPEQSKAVVDVPYFDDVTSEGGWQGHSTKKTMEQLKSEIATAIGRLGGMVTGFQKGAFETGNKKRDGFRIMYTIDAPEGNLLPGRLDVAALPIKTSHRTSGSETHRREQSLKMALFMLRDAMDGLWFLQQLSPGYAPLMPFMLADGDRTVSQLWSESAAMSLLLPPGEDFVDGEVVEQK